jgi:two-component system, LytTR family, response regulator
MKKMNNMNCIVVDDNKMARAAIKQLISQFDSLSLVHECSNSLEAFKFLQNNHVDLVFLDVEMPGMTGIELVKNLDRRPIIILVTAKKNYAVEAFELDVADYMIKPVSLARFTKAIKRASDLFEQGASVDEEEQEEVDKDYIFIRSNSILTKVRANGIIYVQDSGGRVHIQTADKRHVVNSSFSSVQEKLPEGKFYKLHNSYIVALDRIDTVDEHTAYVGKHNLPIGKQFKNELFKKLNLV